MLGIDFCISYPKEKRLIKLLTKIHFLTKLGWLHLDIISDGFRLLYKMIFWPSFFVMEEVSQKRFKRVLQQLGKLCAEKQIYVIGSTFTIFIVIETFPSYFLTYKTKQISRCKEISMYMKLRYFEICPN